MTDIPIVLLYHIHQMQIQPTRAELPRPLVAIRALKVRAAGLIVGDNIPAAAALVGDEWPPAVGLGGGKDEARIGSDGGESVVDAEVGAAEGGEEVGQRGGLLLEEDDVLILWLRHFVLIDPCTGIR